LQSWRVGPLVQTRRYVGLTCSLELGFAFWTRRKLFCLFANLIGPRSKSVLKGYILFEPPTLHDTTSQFTGPIAEDYFARVRCMKRVGNSYHGPERFP